MYYNKKVFMKISINKLLNDIDFKYNVTTGLHSYTKLIMVSLDVPLLNWLHPETHLPNKQWFVMIIFVLYCSAKDGSVNISQLHPLRWILRKTTKLSMSFAWVGSWIPLLLDFLEYYQWWWDIPGVIDVDKMILPNI